MFISTNHLNLWMIIKRGIFIITLFQFYSHSFFFFEWIGTQYCKQKLRSEKNICESDFPESVRSHQQNIMRPFLHLHHDLQHHYCRFVVAAAAVVLALADLQ